jgi:hypothetical protein
MPAVLFRMAGSHRLIRARVSYDWKLPAVAQFLRIRIERFEEVVGCDTVRAVV